jgi:hypothetical protein
MRLTACVLALSAGVTAGCDSSIQMKGAVDDGEEITGIAIATGAWDVSGTVQLISNRGANCVGRFVYEGLAGPNGKMTFTCSDGRTGEANMAGLNDGNAQGLIAGKPFKLKWGRGA